MPERLLLKWDISGDDLNDIMHSVVIPTSNHPQLLGHCLAALQQARTPKGNWEALVMDNSDEFFRIENKRVTESFAEKRFRYISMSGWGLMAARHQGVELASGSLISFIDDDSFISETWLKGVQQTFEDPSIGLVTGPIRPEYEHIAPDWLEYLWAANKYGRYLGYLSLLDFGDTPQIIPAEFVWGCNYSIRKDVFYQANGSHPDYLPPQWKSYQGDGEVGLSVKVGALGFQAYYSPACAIHHLVPASRMTFEYLGNRSFFVGLHQSFTLFRQECGLGREHGVLMSQNVPGSPLRQVRSVMGKLKWDMLVALDLGGCDEISKLKRYLRRCYQDGWQYHRGQLKKDPRLAEYVLRHHYMGDNASFPR